LLNGINTIMVSHEQVDTLIKIIRIFKESLIRQREYDFELKKEFEGWDRLSDEAILNIDKRRLKNKTGEIKQVKLQLLKQNLN